MTADRQRVIAALAAGMVARRTETGRGARQAIPAQPAEERHAKVQATPRKRAAKLSLRDWNRR
jgi:hypothetical protein